MKRHAWSLLMSLALGAMVLSGCQLADEQMAYVDQQRTDCAAAGGYFEENDIGSPDNYTCKGLASGDTAGTLPAQPTECRTETKTVTKKDGSVESRTKQVCSNL